MGHPCPSPRPRTLGSLSLLPAEGSPPLPASLHLPLPGIVWLLVRSGHEAPVTRPQGPGPRGEAAGQEAANGRSGPGCLCVQCLGFLVLRHQLDQRPSQPGMSPVHWGLGGAPSPEVSRSTAAAARSGFRPSPVCWGCQAGRVGCPHHGPSCPAARQWESLDLLLIPLLSGPYPAAVCRPEARVLPGSAMPPPAH